MDKLNFVVHRKMFLQLAYFSNNKVNDISTCPVSDANKKNYLYVYIYLYLTIITQMNMIERFFSFLNKYDSTYRKIDHKFSYAKK